jgi:hypothetical protein
VAGRDLDPSGRAQVDILDRPVALAAADEIADGAAKLDAAGDRDDETRYCSPPTCRSDTHHPEHDRGFSFGSPPLEDALYEPRPAAVPSRVIKLMSCSGAVEAARPRSRSPDSCDRVWYPSELSPETFRDCGMRRREFIKLLASVPTILPLAADAQQPDRRATRSRSRAP